MERSKGSQHANEDSAVPSHARSGELEHHAVGKRPGVFLAVVTSPRRAVPISDALDEMVEDMVGQRSDTPPFGRPREPQKIGVLGVRRIQLYTPADLDDLSESEVMTHGIAIGRCIELMQEQQQLVAADGERRRVNRRRLAEEAVARKRVELQDAERELAEIENAIEALTAHDTAGTA